MTGVEIHRDAPGEAGAGHTQILQARINKVVHHLVYAAARLQKIGVDQKIAHPAGVFAQAEEISLLLSVNHIAAAVGTFAVHQLAFCPERFAGLAVFALVGTLINIALVVHFAEDFLNALHMICLLYTSCYIKRRGQGKFARRFIPRILEDADSNSSEKEKP